jgi:FAD/FMN-containing dehydrogenase
MLKTKAILAEEKRRWRMADWDEIKKEVEAIVGKDNCLDDEEVLSRYSHDESLCPERKPDLVVKVKSATEVQGVVKIANKYLVPVIPRSSGIGFYGNGIPEEGGIIIDLSGMKKILKIDTRNKWVLIQPGVTFGQLQQELQKHGFKAVNPLLPHREKSVITAALEKEPGLSPKMHLDEPILTMELILPNGDYFRTGSMAVPGAPAAPEQIPDETYSDLCNSMGPGIDWWRLLTGAEGAFGIITAMNLKIAPIAKMRRLFFIPFAKVEDAVEPVYRIQRKELGNECFLFNSQNLALILAEDKKEIESIRKVLPSYVVVLVLDAGEWYPEEKMEYQKEALFELGREFLIEPSNALPHVPEAESRLLNIISQAWTGEKYWKFRHKGGSVSIIFLAPLTRVPEFIQIMHEKVAGYDYPAADMGIYIQPKQRTHAFHVELNLSFNPEDQLEKERIRSLFGEASEALINAGAFFYRPYGPWAQMIFTRTGNLGPVLKKVKGILDPNNVMNPGKLGF